MQATRERIGRRALWALAAAAESIRHLDPESLLTAKELTTICGICPEVFRRALRNGIFPAPVHQGKPGYCAGRSLWRAADVYARFSSLPARPRPERIGPGSELPWAEQRRYMLCIAKY